MVGISLVRQEKVSSGLSQHCSSCKENKVCDGLSHLTVLVPPPLECIDAVGNVLYVLENITTVVTH